MTDAPAPRQYGRPTSLPTEAAVPAPAPAPIDAVTHPLRFTGDGHEYFRIWIVNLCLTIVTLGIYGAWAKVRTRKYFYGHTWLDGHNFEYTANPLAILVGHLVVGAVFIAYNLASTFGTNEDAIPVVSLVLIALFVLVTPLLIVKSLRFLARNTVYRGLRFHFHGGTWDAYKKYLLWLIPVPFTFGILYPYVEHLQRRYLARNAAYGTARADFKDNIGEVYITYLIAMALGTGVYMICGMLFLFALIPAIVGGGFDNPEDLFSNLGALIPTLVIGVIAYVVLLIGGMGVVQFIKARMLNYMLSNTTVPGRVAFTSTINPWTLTWIQVSNQLLQFVTLGLYTPWAAVRRATYMLSNVSVAVAGGMEQFTADASAEQSAVGEAATEFFGVDVGF